MRNRIRPSSLLDFSIITIIYVRTTPVLRFLYNYTIVKRNFKLHTIHNVLIHVGTVVHRCTTVRTRLTGLVVVVRNSDNRESV